MVLFDGGGREVPAVIESVQRDRVLVRLGEALSPLRESVLRIRLAQAISARERMDYTIVKAVELGVEALAPVAARRSVVRLDEDRAGKRLAHWQSLVVSACEQCGRNRLPSVEPVLPLAQWLASLPAGGEELRLLLHPGPGQRLRELHPAAAVTLLVGPEGGFAPDEVAAALAAGFLSVCLGPRILRTETAGPAAIAALQALWGDL